MTSAGRTGTGYIEGEVCLWDKQIGRVSASECVSRRPRSPLARDNGELPLPKPVQKRDPGRETAGNLANVF